ncbi:MAG: tRNA pseudouridine(38-40) synthase TruA [Deltaproteobacteria bacterium]|nr:tRNA pseudouridine(38-40) synthase TruA [Deltaproteobacteria bacterium]
MSEGAARAGVLLTVRYDGGRFSGFARQPDRRTVAGELDGAVRAVDPRASLVRGASRTDAGVHALAHPVAFDATHPIPPRGWALALSRHLGADLSVVSAARVTTGYDPRSHVRNKTYRYLVHRSELRDPFLAGRAWRIGGSLDVGALSEELSHVVGRHDFRAFRTASDPRVDTVRTMLHAEARVASSDLPLLAIEITGDRFLHRMVRIIVGAVVDVGLGRLAPGAVRRAIDGGDRRLLGTTAPADGLYLVRSELDDPGQDNWPDQSTSR